MMMKMQQMQIEEEKKNAVIKEDIEGESETQHVGDEEDFDNEFDGMTRTFRIKKIDNEHLSSSDEDKRFQKLSKIAGKYKKE